MPIMVSKNSYNNCLKTMYGFRRFGIKLGLSTIKKILTGLGDPWLVGDAQRVLSSGTFGGGP